MRPRSSFARWVLDSGAVVVFQHRHELMRRDLAVVLRILRPARDPTEEMWSTLVEYDFHFSGEVDYLLARWTDRRGSPRVLLRRVRDSAAEAAVALRRDLVAGMAGE